MTTKVAVRGTLKRVRDRITKPENWCWHSFAQDSAGKTVRLDSEDAICWCLDGALGRECGDDGDLHYSCSQLLRRAIRKVRPKDPCGLINYNDNSTHAEVLALLDHAIGAQS